MSYEIVIRPSGTEYRGIVPQIAGVAATGATPGAALDATYAALCTHLAARGVAAPDFRAGRAEYQARGRTAEKPQLV